MAGGTAAAKAVTVHSTGVHGEAGFWKKYVQYHVIPLELHTKGVCYIQVLQSDRSDCCWKSEKDI